MAVGGEHRLGLGPTRERAEELARDANVIPVVSRFIEDRETPVSAFLKLRGHGPAFLLESAEQGHMGRYSFLGFRPRAVLRWVDGVLADPAEPGEHGQCAGEIAGRVYCLYQS